MGSVSVCGLPVFAQEWVGNAADGRHSVSQFHVKEVWGWSSDYRADLAKSRGRGGKKTHWNLETGYDDPRREGRKG